MTGNYWWAEHDPENAMTADYPWRMTLQTSDNMCHSIEGISFGSEEDCLDYIRTHIIGATLDCDAEPSVVHVTFTPSPEAVAEAAAHLRDTVNKYIRRRGGGA